MQTLPKFRKWTHISIRQDVWKMKDCLVWLQTAKQVGLKQRVTKGRPETALLKCFHWTRWAVGVLRGDLNRIGPDILQVWKLACSGQITAIPTCLFNYVLKYRKAILARNMCCFWNQRRRKNYQQINTFPQKQLMLGNIRSNSILHLNVCVCA